MAHQIHSHHRYGLQPYVVHPAAVVTSLILHYGPEEEVEAAAWLHDVIEESMNHSDHPEEAAKIVDRQIRVACNDRVAELVDVLTPEYGVSRRGRMERELMAIREHGLDAIAIKLADRIANIEQCWKIQDRRLFMYYDEYKEFRIILRTDDSELHLLWRRLDVLLGRKG